MFEGPRNPELRMMASAVIAVFIIYAMYLIGEFIQSPQAAGARLLIEYGGAVCVVLIVPLVVGIGLYHLHRSYKAGEVPPPRRRTPRLKGGSK